MNISPDLIVGGGTAGLIGFLVLVVWSLWKDHQSRDAADRSTIDRLVESDKAKAYALKELAEWAEESGRRRRTGDDR